VVKSFITLGPGENCKKILKKSDLGETSLGSKVEAPMALVKNASWNKSETRDNIIGIDTRPNPIKLLRP
jgi:hypothetical protein